mmetsp:Transcript_4498/g.9396  ORF Transcript_4498/g.9396 Transcript_4498/m.9396 type:complete len:240 (-) Transcript_4498:1099-1818(-)
MSKRLFVHIETDCKTARNMKCGANRTKTSIFSQQYFGFLSKNISLDRLDCIVRTKKCKANGTGIDIRPKEAHYQDEKIKWRDFKSNILPVNKRRKINDVNKYTRTQTYGNIWIRNVPFSRRLDTGIAWKRLTSGSNKKNNDQVQVRQTSCSPSFTVICSFDERRVRGGSAHNIVNPDGVTSPSNRQITSSSLRNGMTGNINQKILNAMNQRVKIWMTMVSWLATSILVTVIDFRRLLLH